MAVKMRRVLLTNRQAFTFDVTEFDLLLKWRLISSFTCMEEESYTLCCSVVDTDILRCLVLGMYCNHCDNDTLYTITREAHQLSSMVDGNTFSQ